MIVIKDARRAVTSHVDIGPAIVIKVQRRNTECEMPVGAINVGLRRDIREGAITSVFIKDVF